MGLYVLIPSNIFIMTIHELVNPFSTSQCFKGRHFGFRSPHNGSVPPLRWSLDSSGFWGSWRENCPGGEASLGAQSGRHSMDSHAFGFVWKFRGKAPQPLMVYHEFPHEEHQFGWYCWICHLSQKKILHAFGKGSSNNQGQQIQAETLG